MAYQYHVFVSYRRKPPAQTWVHDLFVPELRNWMGTELGYGDVFFDEDSIGEGSSYTPKLQSALRASRVMISVLTAEYGQSPWCTIEYRSMMAREKLNGMRTPDNPGGLILPVKFSLSSAFPKAFADVNPVDFSSFATANPAFRSSALFSDFSAAIRRLCTPLSAMLGAVPAYDPDCKVLTIAEAKRHIQKPPLNARIQL